MQLDGINSVDDSLAVIFLQILPKQEALKSNFLFYLIQTRIIFIRLY